MSTEDEVRQVSDRFYAAVNSMLDGDASQMAGVWSHESDVSTMHPLGGRENGWDACAPPGRERHMRSRRET